MRRGKKQPTVVQSQEGEYCFWCDVKESIGVAVERAYKAGYEDGRSRSLAEMPTEWEFTDEQIESWMGPELVKALSIKADHE